MSQYEFVFLLNEEKELKQVKELITSLAGRLLKEESWGEKSLAYPVKNNRTAIFYDWHFQMEENKVAELKKQLNFNEKVLRYLLLVED